MSTSNLSKHYKWNVTNPDNLAGVMNNANTVMEGGLAWGISWVIWGAVVYGLTRKGYDGLNASIAGSLIVAFASLILFLGEWMPQEIPALFFIMTAAAVGYSKLQGPR